MTITEPVIDDKAGYSTICRRGDHVMCQMAGARCACDCHGRHGQTPPIKEPTVSEPAAVTPIHRHACDEPACGRVFDTDHGLAVHRARSHKTNGTGTPPSPKVAIAAPAAAPRAAAGPWLLVVRTMGDLAPAATAVLSTETDVDQVADLVTALGYEPLKFRLEDGRR